MALRPIFIPNFNYPNVIVKDVDFEWHAGFSIAQKRKSIDSLHQSIKTNLKINKILEVSSKSMDFLGVRLSAFNLMTKSPTGNSTCSVESLFQASKVFSQGGPYLDILEKKSIDAKRDPRLRSSGEIISFSINDKEYPLEPKSLFYDWIYINALAESLSLAEEVIHFDAFTDIEFNPKKSFNCQANSVALYVSLFKNKLLSKSLESFDSFKEVIKYNGDEKNTQKSLF